MHHFKTLLATLTLLAACVSFTLAEDCIVECVRRDSACKHFRDDASRVELYPERSPGMSATTKRLSGDKNGVHFEVAAYMDGKFITFDAINGAERGRAGKKHYQLNVNFGRPAGSRSYKLKPGQESCQATIPDGATTVTAAALTFPQ